MATKIKRVLVCGSRDWADYSTMTDRLALLPSSVTIVHGACQGADTLAGTIAAGLLFDIERFPADWKQYGKAAGPIRNQQMLDTGIDLVLAFHPDPNKSKGTKNMLNLAGYAGIPIEIYNGN